MPIFDAEVGDLIDDLRAAVEKDKSLVAKAVRFVERDLGAGSRANWYHVLREDFEGAFRRVLFEDDDFAVSVLNWHRGTKSEFHFAFVQKMFIRYAAARAFVSTMDAHVDSIGRLSDSLQGRA